MAYDLNDVSRDLTRVLAGSASFDVRARLEHHLLTVLRVEGSGAVATLLRAVPGHDFMPLGEGVSEHEIRFVTAGPHPRILVTTYLGPHAASVNVTVEDAAREPPRPDPRHRAFYEVWERLLGIPDADAAGLDPGRRAVFLVGLLESDVMNGGLGQYLTNTDGVHLEDTMRCLSAIGAERTRAILSEAAALGSGAESYAATWASRSAEFERLDDQFLECGEDLAGLTADAYLRDDTGTIQRLDDR
ncbi:MAG: DMP19 family protein [Gemmatimonadota bacterium]|nr:DMP19 family protein [Gemmatimonadota bacterium]MDH5196490.1 DMP19 family protein [Gemmatimonadota bacterium]